MIVVEFVLETLATVETKSNVGVESIPIVFVRESILCPAELADVDFE